METELHQRKPRIFDFEKSNLIDYRILNDTSIEDAVNKLIKIIQKDKNKEN